jgi:hypothetical protein
MVERCIVYESFYYASEYIKKNYDIARVFVWDNHQDEEKREGELLQMNEKGHLIKSKSVIFCQFIADNLFTLKLIIYISSHAIHFEFLHTSINLLINAINKFVLKVDNKYLISCYSF